MPRGRAENSRGMVSITLRVQSTETWSIYRFRIRNRNFDLGYILYIWVPGTLGLWLGEVYTHVTLL